MWGFARPAVICPWLSAAFPLCFFCLIHLFIFPVWQAITWQALPRLGLQEENTAASSTYPAKLRKTHSQDWRFGERACATGVCAAFLQHMWALHLLWILLPCQEPGKALPKAIFSSVSVRSITGPQPMKTLKCVSPVYCTHFLYIMGDGALQRMWPNRGLWAASVHMLLWTAGCCSGAVSTVYYARISFTWLLRQREALAPEEAPLLQIHLSLLVAVWWSLQDLVLTWVSQQSSSDCDEQQHLENVTGWFVSVSWVIRATGFWSSDGKWSFHGLSSQFVLQCMLYLGQDTAGAGTVLVVQVFMPKFGGQMPLTPRENKCIFLQFTVWQQWSSCSLAIQMPPSLPSSILTSWMRKNVFRKCCEMYIYI